MKSFGKKAWILPQPVLIIGTYDENGMPNAMNAAWAGQWDNQQIMISGSCKFYQFFLIKHITIFQHLRHLKTNKEHHHLRHRQINQAYFPFS